MSKAIAFFDFDGTITTHDTMLELAKFYKGNRSFLKGMIRLLPSLIGLKLKFISNHKVKEQFLSHFFRNLPVNEFQQICNRFTEEKLPLLIRPQALERIRELQEKEIPVVVVSASADNWVKQWCDANDIYFIGSRLQLENGKLTGKLEGPNCHSLEKVNRIKELYHLSDYTSIYCYGDTKGDKPMLQLATHAFYKPFRV